MCVCVCVCVFCLVFFVLFFSFSLIVLFVHFMGNPLRLCGSFVALLRFIFLRLFILPLHQSGFVCLLLRGIKGITSFFNFM